jgi:hypothetical protein
MEHTKRLHPFLETLGLIYLTQNFEAVKADMLASLGEMNINGTQFYKQYLSYLENYVQVFEQSYSLQKKKQKEFQTQAHWRTGSCCSSPANIPKIPNGGFWN